MARASNISSTMTPGELGRGHSSSLPPTTLTGGLKSQGSLRSCGVAKDLTSDLANCPQCPLFLLAPL